MGSLRLYPCYFHAVILRGNLIGMICQWCNKTFERPGWGPVRQAAAKHCSVRCTQAARKANRQPIEMRFWPKVDKHGPLASLRPEFGRCWLWTAGTDGNGYGAFDCGDDGMQRAHRVAWRLVKGTAAPDDLHHFACKLKTCVNPDHTESLTRSVHRQVENLGLCKMGHPLSGDNLYLYRGRRGCKICRRDARRRCDQLKSAK